MAITEIATSRETLGITERLAAMDDFLAGIEHVTTDDIPLQPFRHLVTRALEHSELAEQAESTTEQPITDAMFNSHIPHYTGSSRPNYREYRRRRGWLL